MPKARVSAPERIARGEVFEVKTLIAHPMETGFRRDHQGEPVPRNILTEFVCLYNGRPAFRARLHPAMAANPFFAFSLRADVSGTLEFRWTDEQGATTSVSRQIIVDAAP
jgi:sulfur-oxidizing protein SoxZ